MVLLYEARVTNSLLGNFNFATGLQCRALPDLQEIFRARSQAPTGAYIYRLLCIYIANKKFMNVFVTALKKIIYHADSCS